MTIYIKLAEARKLVRETKHTKKGRNTYSKYDYYTPEQVELIVSEVCEKTKLLPICNLIRNEYGLYQELILVDLENQEEQLPFIMATEKGEITATNQTQQMGGTDTYSERYIKMKVFQIKDNNLDFDAQEPKKETKEVKKTIQTAIPTADDLDL